MKNVLCLVTVAFCVIMANFSSGGSSVNSNFTETELASVQELRSRLEDLNSDSNPLAKKYLSEDSTLWRYILGKSTEENPMDQAGEV